MTFSTSFADAVPICSRAVRAALRTTEMKSFRLQREKGDGGVCANHSLSLYYYILLPSVNVTHNLLFLKESVNMHGCRRMIEGQRDAGWVTARDSVH